MCALLALEAIVAEDRFSTWWRAWKIHARKECACYRGGQCVISLVGEDLWFDNEGNIYDDMDL